MGVLTLLLKYKITTEVYTVLVAQEAILTKGLTLAQKLYFARPTKEYLYFAGYDVI